VKRSKITERDRHQLLQVYLHMGLEVSRELCIEYGVSRDYAAKRASEIGKSHRKTFCGGGDIASRVNHADPRWRLAIQRGAVVA
jgi:hypothetical protein